MTRDAKPLTATQPCPNAEPCADHPRVLPPAADAERALRLARRLHELSIELGPQFGLTATPTVFAADDRFGHFLVAISRVLLHEFFDATAAHELARAAAVETITGAAILDANGAPRSLPLPAGHDRVMRMRFSTEELPMRSTQGFVTSAGRFVDRREARRIAVAAGQVVNEKTYQPDELFSEDFIRAAPDAPDGEGQQGRK